MKKLFYGNKTIINPDKDRIEIYIILFSLTQLSNEIFIDSTYKVVPNHFY